MSFAGSIQMIFYSMLTCTIGSQGGPNKMAAANFLWLHFLNNRSSIQSFFFLRSVPGGGAEDSYSAWHFFCVRIIQQKVTSHPVRQRATSLPVAKAKIYGNRFFYSVSKMMIFCNRLHILSLFFVHPVKELSLFTSMDYSTV